MNNYKKQLNKKPTVMGTQYIPNTKNGNRQLSAMKFNGPLNMKNAKVTPQDINLSQFNMSSNAKVAPQNINLSQFNINFKK